MQILVYDDTFSLIREVWDINAFMGLLLILFILIAAFTVLNQLIGVICEIVSETKKAEEIKLLKRQLEGVFTQLDTMNTGFITRSELESSVKALK